MGIFNVVQYIVVDVEGQVGSYHIGIFQRCQLRQSQTEGILDGHIDGCCIGDAVFHDGDGFSPKRMLQTVCDESRYVLVAQCRLLSDLRHEFHDGVCRIIVGGIGSYHFHQRNQVTRVPEVGSHETVSVFQISGDLGRTHYGRVGAEDAVLSAACFQLSEGFPLQIHVFKHGFDHQVCILDAVAFDILCEVDSG